MAFQTGTSSSIENLMTQLSTFAQANGWTQDGFTAEGANGGRLLLSKNAIFVAWVWFEATDGGVMACAMNTSNDDTADPWLSTGDDGAMYSNPDGFPASIDSRRCVNQFAGPHVAYWFFENDSNPAYIHVVVEVDTNRFRHFGFGELEKIGDWAGGEYSYGHFWAQGTTSIDDPANGAHAYGLGDGGSPNNTNYAASMKAQGLDEMIALDGGSTWMMLNGAGSWPASIDRAGTDRGRGMGSSRQGGAGSGFAHYRLSQLTAFKPLIPQPVFMANTSLAPDQVMLLGTQPDVRMVNMANIEPGEVLTVAGEDWYCFPWVVKKRDLDNTEESWNAGTAYRRENA